MKSVKNFDEVSRVYTEDEAVSEANRCLFCKNPLCVKACPISQDVPGYVARISEGDFEGALKIIMKDNPFPGSCGRICPHSCEGRCILKKKGTALSIMRLKRFVADRVDPSKSGIKRGKPTGKNVGVIGSGPAGLSSAYYLTLSGHSPVVYESFKMAGGMLTLGIPEYRLPRAVVKKEIEFIKSLGVTIKTGVKVSSLNELNHDAIFIGVGAHLPMQLNLEGMELSGIKYGISFLKSVNQHKKQKIGRRVAVIGGGSVAIDASRTALRLGGEEVAILYRRSSEEMPAYTEEIEAAEEEGIQIHYLTSPVRIIGENGKVKALECIRNELGECDSRGRCRPMPLKGSEFTIEVDTVIPAISQIPDLSWVPEGKLEITKNRTLSADQSTAMTKMKGIFAGGDCVSGPATVVDAIAVGKRAASSIDRYL